jgi:hypothetical protein
LIQNANYFYLVWDLNQDNSSILIAMDYTLGYGGSAIPSACRLQPFANRSAGMVKNQLFTGLPPNFLDL